MSTEQPLAGGSYTVLPSSAGRFSRMEWCCPHCGKHVWADPLGGGPRMFACGSRYFTEFGVLQWIKNWHFRRSPHCLRGAQ